MEYWGLNKFKKGLAVAGTGNCATMIGNLPVHAHSPSQGDAL